MDDFMTAFHMSEYPAESLCESIKQSGASFGSKGELSRKIIQTPPPYPMPLPERWQNRKDFESIRYISLGQPSALPYSDYLLNRLIHRSYLSKNSSDGIKEFRLGI